MSRYEYLEFVAVEKPRGVVLCKKDGRYTIRIEMTQEELNAALTKAAEQKHPSPYEH